MSRLHGNGGRGVAHTIDWWLIAIYAALVLIGCLNIYASIQSFSPESFFDLSERSGKQFLWAVISIGVGAFILFGINPKFWDAISKPAYILVFLLLIAVIFMSRDVKGSHSWFTLGPVSFQPAEISKITTSLLLASLLSSRKLPAAIAAILLPMLAIVAESETGSALVYAGFIFVLYREGLSGWFISIGGICILLFILSVKYGMLVAFIVLVAVTAFILYLFLRNYRGSLRARRQIWRRALLGFAAGCVLVLCSNYAMEHILGEHQRSRIEVLLGMKEDPMRAGYNVRQSLIAIGSGGMFGKGYLEGTQTAYGFVPEQSTDFIFCTIGEEWGFAGSTLVLLLYALLIFRILSDAEESREDFTRIYGYCMASCLFMHLFINVGMTLGIMPVIGIPLPFISYGGSSLLSFSLMLAIFLALVRQERKYF